MSIPGFAWALEQGAALGLHAADRLVLIYLADKANGIGVCWPGQETIVRFTGLSLRTVRTSIHRLAKLGPITLEEAPGIATRYIINRDLTPANGTGVDGADPGKPAHGYPGNIARGTPANGTGAPRQTSTPHPGKSCTEPRQNLHGTPANQHPEPLREPLREPRGARGAREGKASVGINSHSSQEHIQPAPHLLPAAPYASPDEARATFAAYLAAKRRRGAHRGRGTRAQGVRQAGPACCCCNDLLAAQIRPGRGRQAGQNPQRADRGHRARRGHRRNPAARPAWPARPDPHRGRATRALGLPQTLEPRPDDPPTPHPARARQT